MRTIYFVERQERDRDGYADYKNADPDVFYTTKDAAEAAMEAQFVGPARAWHQGRLDLERAAYDAKKADHDALLAVGRRKNPYRAFHEVEFRHDYSIGEAELHGEEDPS